MGALRTAAVHAAAGVFNGLYRLFCLGKRHDEVLFVSRKADIPSYDYLECGAAFEERGFAPVYLTQRLGAKTVFPYAWLVLREIYHLARCRVCVVDRYDPVVCLINFKCEKPEAGEVPTTAKAPDAGEPCEAAEAPSASERAALHRVFPVEPVVVQLWHAFGAFKKFGYQALDIAEGHSTDEAMLFKIHRNYSWIVCSGEGARAAFAEAFACPKGRVVPLSRPTQRRMKELAEKANREEPSQGTAGAAHADEVGVASQVAAASKASTSMLADKVASDAAESTPSSRKPVVLFAPTIRKYDKTAHPVQDLMERADELFAATPYEVRWALHPLESGKEASGGVPAHVVEADYVVTDYSSIVYEAYLLGKRVVFFVPDVEHYRRSPGLNVDPTQACPQLCAATQEELFAKLGEWARRPEAYPQNELEDFIDGAFEGSGEDPAADIAEFVIRKLSESESK